RRRGNRGNRRRAAADPADAPALRAQRLLRTGREGPVVRSGIWRRGTLPMMGCSKHQSPVSECTACTRVAHAREQLELAASAEPHVDWSRVNPRWRQATLTQKRPYVMFASLFASGLALALTMLIFAPHRQRSISDRNEAFVTHVTKEQPTIPTESMALATAVTGEVRAARGTEWESLGVGDRLPAGTKVETETGHASLQWGEGTGAALADKTELAMAKLNAL